MTRITTLLRNIPLFSGFDERKLVELSRVVMRRKFPGRTILFSKGDESDSVYLVLKGSARAIINDENGREIMLNQFGPGDFFGEFALLDGRPRSASVVTREALDVIVIRKSDFHQLLFSEPEVMFELVKIFLAKLRDATETIESLSFFNVYDRITRLLLKLAAKGDNGLSINERPTHKEIANMVGASREMVSKVMKQLVDGGYLVVEGRGLKIAKSFPRQF